jgi:hypothetical protein
MDSGVHDKTAIFDELRKLLLAYVPPYTVRIHSASGIDLWAEGSFECMGTTRPEMFFASAIIQNSCVGFYFMPVYAGVESMQKLIPLRLRPMLKGTSCFHIKEWDDELAHDIRTLLKSGFAIYNARGWV